MATRPAPAAGKRRPAPLVVSDENASPTANCAPAGGKRNTIHKTLSTLNGSVPFEVRNEDLRTLMELGQGNGGSVMKVEHVPTGTIMAKKVCMTC